MFEQSYRRNWFPDEQIAPERVLACLTERRKLATTQQGVIPWMSTTDLGITLGLLTDHRWTPAHYNLENLLKPDPTVCRRLMPNGLRWRHVIAKRDVLAALRHYEVAGLVFRLPHPLATCCVYLAPLDAADAAAMVDVWAAMDAAREEARHAQRMYRMAAGRRAAGGA